MGGECVYAVDINPAAAKVYERNWGLNPLGDITKDANDTGITVPAHDVLCAGFPCQPFSKSGNQLGMEETRGTLYWNILKIIEKHHPKLVILENVRNLAGPRHRHEWEVIIGTLREAGYRVSSAPAIFSPHLLPLYLGGRPQIRERVYIIATYTGKRASKAAKDAEPAISHRPVDGWHPREWLLTRDTPVDELSPENSAYALTAPEIHWLDAWEEFVSLIRQSPVDRRLPGFPIWADAWKDTPAAEHDEAMPDWKREFITKNQSFYATHKKTLDAWAKRWGVFTDKFPASRRKFEWQAQGTPHLWDAIIQFRPSGIRAKAPTYAPALVAITQTTIVGPTRRRLTPREAARLQGLPDWFDFGDQPDKDTYRQLGNGISVGALWYVIKQHAERDAVLLERSAPSLLAAIRRAPTSPDTALLRMRTTHNAGSTSRRVSRAISSPLTSASP